MRPFRTVVGNHRHSGPGTKGFTLIELVIVIVIISILSIVSVPLYRGYTRRAMASEGRVLVSAVAKAQKIYLVEKNSYLATASTGFNTVLDVDARVNKFFTAYAVSAGGSGSAATASFRVTTAGIGDASGISITLSQPWGASPTVSENGI